MPRTPEWKIQLAWWSSGLFATGAAWYFLSLNNYKLFVASLALAFALAAIAIYLHKKRDAVSENFQEVSPALTPAEEFVRRYLDEPSEIRFIKAMPKMRLVMYKMCQEGWDTGITSEMKKASYDLIDFLESSWVRLAEFYPENHFGNTHPKAYIRQFIQDRFAFHWAKHEPDGPGTGGTIVGIMAGGNVIGDLESMIADTVSALFSGVENLDLKLWLKEWRRKP